jgi:large subunit ribosomal protein L31
MNIKIQPKYETITVTCSCGNKFETRSTICKDLQLDICSSCHPFYSGKQRVVDTAGRVDTFQKRFGNMKKLQSYEK